jgi:hypothetical protein
MPDSPLRDLHRHNDHLPPPRLADSPPLLNVGALQRVQEVDAPPPHLRTSEPAQPVSPDQTSLLIGLWALIGAVAVIGVFILRLPFAFGLFFVLFAGRAVKDPKVLSRVRALLDSRQTSRVIGKE